MASGLRSTPLFENHIAAGARMAPFAGWNMPINYPGGIIAEHQHTRNRASVFDICHMGELRIFGPGAAAALDRRLARPVLDQKLGVCRYNFLLNENGGVIDDLIVYKMAEEDFFLVVNAANLAADREELAAALPEKVQLEDLSEYLAKIDLQGPASAEVLNQLGIPNTELPRYFHCRTIAISGIPCILSRTGYTGELGFEIYFDAERAGELWDIFLVTQPVRPAGLGARDTLRLEAGLPLHGHELTPETTPIEAGFGSLLKLQEMPEREFTGRAALEKRPVTRQLVGIRLESRRAARAGATVYHQDTPAGIVTSGAFAPSVGTAVAMAYVTPEFTAVGTPLTLDAGSARLSGQVVPLPFYSEGTVRMPLNGTGAAPR